MTKEYASSMWLKYLESIREDYADRVLKNPALDFTKKAKSGYFDDISDAEYNSKLDDVEAESRIFENKAVASSYLLLIRALRTLSFNAQEWNQLIDVLSDAAAHSDFNLS